MAYYAGVAAALAGRGDDAAEMFGLVLRSSGGEPNVLGRMARHMARLANQPSAIRDEIAALVARQREALRLPPSDCLLN
jgi:hypothetical protein